MAWLMPDRCRYLLHPTRGNAFGDIDSPDKVDQQFHHQRVNHHRAKYVTANCFFVNTPSKKDQVGITDPDSFPSHYLAQTKLLQPRCGNINTDPADHTVSNRKCLGIAGSIQAHVTAVKLEAFTSGFK